MDENDKNCYEKCNNYFYFDTSHKYHCTDDAECPPEQSKLISQKKKCIDECKNDNKYKNEFNNICYEICPNGTVQNNYICVEEEPMTTVTEEEPMTTTIEEELMTTKTTEEVPTSAKTTEEESMTTKSTEE